MKSSSQTNKAFYVVGGTLLPDAPSYIERDADQQLYDHILAGHFCYVLTSRQMGKSSLMARTAERLRKEDVSTAIVDLTRVGSEEENFTADRWYYGVAHRITRDIDIKANLAQWWQSRKNQPALQRLTEFFSDLVLVNTSDQVVVFVDEIDATIGLRFTDDFFAAIRACYNARATEPGFRRLSFVLLGSASPSELIKDVRRTPFNIGHRIELADFTFEEARPLAGGLGVGKEQCERALQHILHWTGGHPYLTQKTCYAIAQQESESCADTDIDRIVEKQFLLPEANHEDTHFTNVRDLLTHDKRLSRKLLKLYRRIYQGAKIIDAPLSPVHSALKLSSIVAPSKDRFLHVRNRIYERVFTDDWARKAMPDDWNRRIAAVAVLLLGFGILYMVYLSRTYINVLQTANDNYQAYDAYNKLHRIPGCAGRANELLAEFWDRRALPSEAQENRDEALLLKLKALSVHATDRRRSEVNLLAGKDYGNLLFTYRHNTPVNGVAFSPDGDKILTGSNDGTARLWSVDTGQPIGQPFSHGNWVLTVAFSPDANKILTGSRDGIARLWSIDTGQPVVQTFNHGERVQAAAFSPDGTTLLTGGSEGTARLWDVKSGQSIGRPFRHGDWITSVSFSPDGKTFLTGSSDKTARLWSVDTGQPIGQPFMHEEWVQAVAFSPDGENILTGSSDGKAQLWSLETGQPIGEPLPHERAVTSIAFSPDGKTLLTGSRDGAARLWSIDTGRLVSQPFSHGNWVLTVAFSRNGDKILTGSRDGATRLWGIDTSQPVNYPFNRASLIQYVAFSPDGKTVLTRSNDGTVRLWDVDTGRPIGQPFKLENSVISVGFNPDRRTILTGSNDRTVRLWDVDTGQLIGQPLSFENKGLTVAFSPDGNTTLAVSGDGMSQLWSIYTSRPVGLPFYHTGFPQSVAFSPDRKTLIIRYVDGTAQLWNIDEGQPIGKLFNHTGSVHSDAFSPDGKTLLIRSNDGTALLRSVDSSQPIGQPFNHVGSILGVAFGADGKTAIFLTPHWAHQWIIDGDNFTHIASRTLSGIQIEAYRFLYDSENRLLVVSDADKDSLKIETWQFDSPNAPPMQGDPNSLLDEWQKRIGLKFDDQGKLIPLQ